MPSTPTTKSQVQAYRFVLRRMQSALVRKDAVMLHDPMRTHSRATIVGVCLAAVGLIGFLIWGILSPKPKPPNEDGIVIGKPSGQVYVLVAKPEKQLIPVFNLASARLLLQARQEQAAQAGGEGAAKAAATAGGDAKVVAPKLIDDNELRGIPKERKAGIPEGPELLPSADQRVSPPWTVCDKATVNENAADPNVDENVATEKNSETTVMAGVDQLGAELKKNESLLVRLDVASPGQKPEDQKAYLVYRTPGTANLPNTSAVRAEVDLSNAAVKEALALNGIEPREISVGLLNAIPEKAALEVPDIPGLEQSSEVEIDDPDLRQVGSVFEVQRAGSPSEFYVVHRNGLEQVKRTTADMLRFSKSLDNEIKVVSPDVITRAETVNEIDDNTFPENKTEVLRARNFPVACLSWKTVGLGDNREERTAVYIGKEVPGNPAPVRISSPSADGVRIDFFYMPPGRGAVTRQATSKEDFDTGQITLVSDRGIKYGIPNARTAALLGLNDQLPAPSNILELLPDGSTLSTEAVLQSFDTLRYEQGEYPSKDDEQQGGGGNGGSGQSGGG